MNLDSMPDRELMQKVSRGSGNKAAFQVLFRRHASLVFGMAYARLHNRDDSEDVVQDVFERVWRYRRSYNHEEQFGPWLVAITRNRLHDVHVPARIETVQMDNESDQERLTAALSAASAPYLVDELADEVTTKDAVLRALGSLRDSEREILLLKFYMQQTYSEIAKATGKNEEAVRKAASRALLKLRARLLGEETEADVAEEQG